MIDLQYNLVASFDHLARWHVWRALWDGGEGPSLIFTPSLRRCSSTKLMKRSRVSSATSPLNSKSRYADPLWRSILFKHALAGLFKLGVVFLRADAPEALFGVAAER